MDYYLITEDPINLAEALSMIDDPSTGAQAIFLGTVRNEFEGRASLGLYYDVYPPMAQSQIRKIGEALKEEFDIRHVVIIHRIGELPVGAASVLVAVSAPHREQAFAAAKAGIDRVKQQVPIWKKEHWADGSSQWHDEPDGTQEPR
ncbi:molybdenum cofactor biosynthesis protein MoaE [Sulfobacillus thermosulfidooxidans]|uniref:molybdenum cofactor biosynthesis protein MoaE n=1 Tax=Sulfobacillus thermosulfidooxidans TaxID=28034 RepID=UPI00096BA2AF|nr:molybdenum cofactor biosynthesis protein MoaE [Sulfobacillus thermosulfidooxidans]OLZ08100.1 molybdopterin synthase [Sulfobacillus thermosulfidooxidans]OLZ16514.1 molybdopterin synthase [Sulfobacillus thermosulfidooxidans]OLZ19601.1 molybdopterin synthase [Sulfobacillus thermosulfidooxidans]